MKTRLISLTATVVTAGAAIALAATSAFASAPHAKLSWSVSPGGSIKGVLNSGTTTILKDTTSGNSVTCKVSTAVGSLKSGSGLSGSGIGKITSISWGTSTTKCTGPFSSAWTATGTATSTDPWMLNATGYASSVDGGQTSGTITEHDATGDIGVGATLHGTVLGAACTAVVGGTTSAPASASVLYDNTSGLLAATGTSGLKVLSSNCPGLTKGDSVTFFTSPTSKAGTAVSHGYAISPKQKIVG
jgi:hypothetical protein